MIWLKSSFSERKNEWGHLFSIQHDSEGRDLLVVEFHDGSIDVWPSWGDPVDYDVRIQNEPPEDLYVYQGEETSAGDRPAGDAIPDVPGDPGTWAHARKLRSTPADAHAGQRLGR